MIYLPDLHCLTSYLEKTMQELLVLKEGAKLDSKLSFKVSCRFHSPPSFLFLFSIIFLDGFWRAIKGVIKGV
jgi:hypothetical protein